MKRIILSVFLWPLVANAQNANVGCFVDKLSFPYCSELKLTCDLLNPITNVANFGPTIAYLCDDYIGALKLGIEDKKRLDAAIADRNYWYNEAQGCNSAFATEQGKTASCSNQYNSCATQYNAQIVTIRALRRACGAKCKRIK